MSISRARAILAGIVAGLVVSGCAPPEERAAAYLARAQELYAAGEYENAKLEAKNAAQVEPRNAEAHYLLALIAEEDDELRQMLGHLNVAVDVDPSMWKARIKLGNILYFARAYEQAAEQAKAALELAPQEPDAHVLQGRVLLQAGDRAGAHAEVVKALELDANHAQALALEASILARDAPDEALAVLDDAIPRVGPEDAKALREIKLVILGQQQRSADIERELIAMTKAMPEERSYQVRLARLYASRGRPDEAERLLRELAKTGPAGDEEEIDGRLALLQFLAEFRNPQAVEETLKEFIAKSPEDQGLKLALGQFYEESGRHEEATKLFEQVAALDRKSEQGLRARNKLAAQRIRAGDVPGATKLIAEVLEDAPDNVQAQLTRAALSFADARYDDAIASLRVVLRREPEHQPALLMLAHTHARKGEEALAKDAYRKILEINPRNVEAAREFVALSARSGTMGDATETLKRIAKADPANVQMGALLSEVLAFQGDLQGAEAQARQVASAEDATGLGAFQLGQVLEGQQRHAEAARAYAQALEKSPDDLLMLQGLVRALEAQGKRAEAIADLRGRVKAGAEATNARLVLAAALGRDGREQEAAALVEEVIAAEPKLQPAYLVLASLYPDDPETRIAAYRRGLTALPGDSQLGFELGAEYQRLGRRDEAIALFEELLVANPTLDWVRNDLAATLLEERADDPASVRRAVQLAESLRPTTNPLVLDTIGWAYQRAGRHEEAIDYLERAAVGAAGQPAVHYHLGMAYLAAGDTVRARQSLEQSLSAGMEFAQSDAARRALAGLDAPAPN